MNVPQLSCEWLNGCVCIVGDDLYFECKLDVFTTAKDAHSEVSHIQEELKRDGFKISFPQYDHDTIWGVLVEI